MQYQASCQGNSMNQRILIIDDDKHFAQVLERSLSRRGYNTRIALNADQALAILKQDSFEWISLDLRLGDDSSLRLLPELKPLCTDETRIVVLTGFASIPTAVEAVKQGAFNYLHKPASVKELIQAFEGTSPAPALPEEDTPMSVERLEWEHIQRVLHENDGNISSTARALGMHRRTLQRKLQKRPVRS